MKDAVINIIIGLTLVFVVIMGMSWLCFFVSEKKCLSSYENQNPEWGVWSGCRVVINGVLTPVDIVRELN